MAKALNQNFFTATLYGSQDPNGKLTLQSTSSVMLGEVEVVGASLDLVIGGYVGSFVHTNTADRLYTLPDYDGTLLAGGLYTVPNQIAYSLAANSVTVLNPVNDAVLTTDPAGAPTWLTGSTGDYLQIVAGAPVFAPLPDNGTVALGTAQELAYYAANGNDVLGLATTTDRVLLSPTGNLTWGLITAEYLSDSASNPLGTGTAGQKLKSIGDGTFYWDNDTFVINPGTQNFVSYYTQPGVDTEVGSSGFLEVDETTNTLKLNDAGSINFYEDQANGFNYIALKAPATVTGNPTFTLPGADGLAGDVLSTDGLGNLIFSTLTFGTVSAGVTNDIAYYAASGTTVSGLTTTSDRVLLSPIGNLTWGLITTNYLADTGPVPLAPGTAGDILSSNGDSTFSWVTAAALSEEKRQGSVGVPSGASTVTVLYDDPFATTPKVVMAQWSLEGASLPATMPVISVAASDLDGFTLQLSTTTTQAYLLYWYVSQDGTAVTTLPYVYLAGGDDSGTYQTAIQYFSFMTDTTIATVASIPTAVGYTQTTASATYGFINGGQTGLAVSVDTVYSFNYTTATVALEVPPFAFPRSSGAGVGTRDNGFVCGGEDVSGPTTLMNIEKIAHATVTISLLGAALTGSNTACGSATSRTHGYVALADGSVDKFEYTSETVVANNPGFTANAQVGCNDIIAGVGYFGTSAGDLQSYDFATDTATVISTPGFTWSSAANSLTHGFFTEGGGSNVAYRFSFATGVLSASGVIGFNAEDASISTFQSKGIL